jgi:hypothetical protein
MTAKLATVDDHILAGVEAAGAMGGGSIVPRSASEKLQGAFTQFDSGYLSPYFVTDPERMEVAFENAYILIHEKQIGSKKDLLPLLEQITNSGKAGETAKTISDAALMIIAVAENPCFADRTTGQGFREQVGQAPAAPEPILIDWFKSQRIQKYSRSVSLVCECQHARLTRHLGPPSWC